MKKKKSKSKAFKPYLGTVTSTKKINIDDYIRKLVILAIENNRFKLKWIIIEFYDSYYISISFTIVGGWRWEGWIILKFNGVLLKETAQV